MADGTLKNYTLGKKGVNTDKNPIELDDDELRQAQNAIRDPLGNDSGLRKRPGLVAFTTTNAGGIIMGGVSVPLMDQKSSGTRYLYLGRGKDV